MLQVATLVPIIVGISQVVKNTGFPSKFIPLLNLVLGIGLTFLSFDGLAWHEQVIQGLMVGLSACGIYDQSKSLQPTFTGSSTDADTANAATQTPEG